MRLIIFCKYVLILQKNESNSLTLKVEQYLNIGVLQWSDKQLYLRPVRGKRVAMKVKTNESYSNLLQKAISKLRTFYKDLLDTEYEYVLTFENGDVANITDEFTLSKYKEEIAKILKVLYCTSFNIDKSSNSS